MTKTALVVGGTGPTGPHVVTGLLERGFEVTILHTGAHEVDEITDHVTHVHTDPFNGDAVTEALGDHAHDLAVIMYGRLRDLVTRVDAARLVTIGGVGVYRGFMDPLDLTPAGLPVPTSEGAPTIDPEVAASKLVRMRQTEDAVFAAGPPAVHLRYPMLYGPRQLVPREWCIVRRVLDRRPFIVLPDAGLTLKSVCHVENAAYAVLCAVDHHEVGAGKIYNVCEEPILSLAQMVEVIAGALGHEWEIVSMPWELAAPARPLMTAATSTHRVLSTAALRSDLEYTELREPSDGYAHAARWLADNPPERGGDVETRLQDPFDYAAEDRLVAAWRRALADFPKIEFARDPGTTSAFRPRPVGTA